MAELNARDSKLVQYLNEAYGKEKELETTLEAHIGMASRGTYRKRLQQHLAETRGHARELERRIKKIGGRAQTAPIDAPEPLAKGASAALELGSLAVAVAQAPLHAIRGTGEKEKMLKNAKSEYANEHLEIATYTAIESLADAVGDKDTAKLARSIRREEERMAKFLERLIPQLTKAVAQEEIPAAERRPASSARRSTGVRKRAGGARTTRSSARAGTSSSKSRARGAKASRSSTPRVAARRAKKVAAKGARAIASA